MRPTLEEAKTLFSYVFIIGLGAYFGDMALGTVGVFFGAVLAIPVAIVVGMAGLFVLATVLGYDARTGDLEEDG